MFDLDYTNGLIWAVGLHMILIYGALLIFVYFEDWRYQLRQSRNKEAGCAAAFTHQGNHKQDRTDLQRGSTPSWDCSSDFELNG